jgi:hypothetical protein
MKHLTYADKSLLVGDTAADLMLEYAAALSASGGADTLHLTCLDVDGKRVEATFLLGQGAPLMAETSFSDLAEPDNATAEDFLRAELTGLSSSTSQMRLEDQVGLGPASVPVA